MIPSYSTNAYICRIFNMFMSYKRNTICNNLNLLINISNACDKL